MIKPELFHKTVGILVEAYSNDTLRHDQCCACAVGNIVAYNCGIKDNSNHGEWIEKTGDTAGGGWGSVFCTGDDERHVYAYNYESIPAAKLQIDSTGYTWQELARVEYAFETAPKGNSEDDWMLNGLLAVYDVLCDIHQVDAKDVKPGKEVFQLCS